MLVVRSLVVLVAIVLLSLDATSTVGADKKNAKKDGKHYAGVIIQVHRDGNPKDNDIGFIVLKVGNDAVKITVMKNTDIDGKGNTFKDLDKGDQVTVHARVGQPHVAGRIVIRKN